jgi:hypothetical protein
MTAADLGANRLRFRGITPAPTRPVKGAGVPCRRARTRPACHAPPDGRGSAETIPQAVRAGNGGNQVTPDRRRREP